MNNEFLPVYYYPTRIYLIDDNQEFLMNFSLQLDPKLAYEIFSSAREPLPKLLQEKNKPSLIEKLLSHYEEANIDPMTQQTISLNLTIIQDLIFNRHRFDEVTVVIVDYDMPGMNGLEFCQQLQNLPIKKIMLTGKADEKIAIKAFNQGLIDAFVQKQSDDVIQRIDDLIKHLQYNYFQKSSEIANNLLAINSPVFLRDERFVGFFRNFFEKRQLAEFYLIETTGTFLFLDFDGNASALIVKNYDDLALQYSLAKNAGVEPEILEFIRAGLKLPFSLKASDYYTFSKTDWAKHLYNTETLQFGEDTYYYAYVEELPDFDKKSILSYHQHLDHLDMKFFKET